MFFMNLHLYKVMLIVELFLKKFEFMLIKIFG